ncbi:MAG TPA: Gldg family protein [Rhizomicrobium sp.]|nr:Gldg family protein [Rhizomicrobium sp.]
MKPQTSNMMSRRVYAIAATILAVVIFVAINIWASTTLTTAKLDLTENGQFTLAKGTRNIIASLKEPITLKFYYSKQAAAEYSQTVTYSQRVRDLLQTYAAISHGKITVEEVDPEPFTEAEDQATAAGLSGAPTENGDAVYFGLVGTNRIDGREVIPYFATEREQYLEYDLTSLVYRLSTPKKPIIGIVPGLPIDMGAGGMQAMMQGQAQPYAAYSELAQTFQTKMIRGPFTKIPKDSIDVLMVVHPATLGPAQLEAIDQYALSGGRVLVFVDPASDLSQQGANPYQPAQTPPASDMPSLFKAWGIAYNPSKVVGDRALAQRVQTRDPMNPTTLYPVWLHLTSDNFDAKDPLTASLQNLNLATVGALHALKGATTTFSPLITSSDQSSLIDAVVARMTQNPDELMGQIEPTGEKFVIAARVSGPAKSAFPDAKIKAGNINVVVMADTDVFDDRFWVRIQTVLGKKLAAPFADNGAFILNAVENLSGSDDMISLRTREAGQRPFTVVRDIQAKAQAQYQEQQQRLQQHVNETQQKLHELQEGGEAQAGQVGLSPAQEAEIERFRRDLAATRTQLREVQRNLRKDIDSLGAWLAFVNIALVPILIVIFAVAVAMLRRRRSQQARTVS